MCLSAEEQLLRKLEVRQDYLRGNIDSLARMISRRESYPQAMHLFKRLSISKLEGFIQNIEACLEGLPEELCFEVEEAVKDFRSFSLEYSSKFSTTNIPSTLDLVQRYLDKVEALKCKLKKN